MLNSWEYFVTKLLIKGDVEASKDFVFKVTAEDLPSEILSVGPLMPPIMYGLMTKSLIINIVYTLACLITLGIICLFVDFSSTYIIIEIVLFVMLVIFVGFNIFTWIYLRLKKKYREALKKFSN